MSYQSAINHGTAAYPGGPISVGPIVPLYANSLAVVVAGGFLAIATYGGWSGTQGDVLYQQFSGQPSITNIGTVSYVDNVNDEWAAVMAVYETDGTPVLLSGGGGSFGGFHYPSVDPHIISVNQKDAILVYVTSGTAIASGQNGGDFGITVHDSDNNSYTLVKAMSDAPHENVVYLFSALNVNANAALTVTITGGNGSPSIGPVGWGILTISHLVDTPAAPTVTSVIPSSGTSLGGTSVTITGTAFVATPTVTFDGVAATSVVWVNSTQLTAVTPVHAVGAVNVVVTNPDTQSGTLVGGYTYTAPPLPPLPPPPPPPPTIVASFNRPSIFLGQSSTLSWVSGNATTVSIDNGIGGVVLTGSKTVNPIVTTVYHVTATGLGGTATYTVTLKVTPDTNYLEGPPSYGTIVFDLVGFGSVQPYWTDSTGRHFAVLHYEAAAADPTLLASIPLIGNDLIVPAGTSYQVTVLSPDLGFVSQGRFKFTGLLFNFNTATPVQPL